MQRRIINKREEFIQHFTIIISQTLWKYLESCLKKFGNFLKILEKFFGEFGKFLGKNWKSSKNFGNILEKFGHFFR